MRYQIKPILLLIILTLLPACAGNQTMPPGLEEQLSYTPQVILDYEADLEWWKLYEDPQLDQLIQTALEHNLDLARSAIGINRALYQANRLGADLLPSFSGNLSGQSGNDLKSGDNTTRTFDAQFGVRYEIDLWRRLSDSASAQEWEYLASIEDKEAIRLLLINNVIETYYHLAYLQGALLATRDNIAHYQRIEELTKTKYLAGKMDALEPAQARQAWLAAENNALNLESQQKEAELTLRNLLNLRPQESLSPNYPDLLKVYLPPVDLDVPLAVLAHRPDLRAAENRLQKAFKSLHASQKSWYPTLSLGANLTSASGVLGRMFDLPQFLGFVTIDLPFLNWNRLQWDIKISEADFESAKLDFAQSLTNALNEVDNYNFQFLKAREILDKTQEKYTYDVAISGYYDTRYRFGANELSDWLNALNTEASSRLTLINNHYTMLRYQTALYKSLAGRYTARQPELTSEGVQP